MNHSRWSSAICPLLSLVQSSPRAGNTAFWLAGCPRLITVLAETNIVTNICLVFCLTTIWTYNMLIVIHSYRTSPYNTVQHTYFQKRFYCISMHKQKRLERLGMCRKEMQNLTIVELLLSSYHFDLSNPMWIRGQKSEESIFWQQ